MRKKRLCLDACLFIALHSPDRYDVEVVSAIRSVLDEIETGKAYAVISSVIEIELLDGSLEIIEPLCDGRKGEFVDADRAITALARRIRSAFTRRGSKKFEATLEVPDCIYIATAIIYECDYLVTIDGLNNNRLSPLAAAAEIEKQHRLKIRSPIDCVSQMVLDFGGGG